MALLGAPRLLHSDFGSFMLIRYKSYIGSTRYKVRNSYYQGKGTFVAGVVSNDLSLVEDISAHRNVSCFSGRFSTSGSITVQASGGVAPYIYSMDSNFSTYNSTGVFDDLFITGPITESTDEYGDIIICTKTIYAKDSNNHTTSIDVQLQSPGELNFRTFPNDVVLYCDEGQNYATYECDPPTLTTYANNPTFNITVSGALSSNSLPADGHYPVGVTTIRYRIDDRICRATPAARQYTVTVLPELTLSEDISMHHNVTCFDGNDGSITVIASGGAAPYMYSMDSSFSTYNTTGVFDTLSITGPITEGTDGFGGILTCTKTIYVKDANNHMASIDVNLQSPVELEILGCPDDITVYCDPGQTYATVVWSAYLSTTANNGHITNISNVMQDNHYPIGETIIAYSAQNDRRPCGERIQYSFTITVLPELTLAEDISAHQDVTCFNRSNGSITVQASGGMSPYLYSIDGTNWQSLPTFSNLSVTGPITEGTDQYGGILICTKTIYVKDANDHVESINVQLKSPVEFGWDTFPDDIVVFCDPGENYATVIFDEPTLTTYHNNASISHGDYPTNNQYPIGNTRITYRVINGCKPSTFPSKTLSITVLHPYYQNAIQDYDGNWYDAVVIGEQVWLAQNLRTTHYADGTPISNGGNNQSDTIPYYYDYSTPNIPLNLRGYLYNWPAVMNGAPSSSTNPSGVQGIAPSGWHIPSYNELYQLDEYVGNQSIYNYNNQDGKNAKALAYDNYWYNSSVLGSPGNDQTSNNATMFGVIPAGYMYSAGNFSSATTRGYLWSSTKTTTTVSIYAENHTVDMFSSSGLNAYYGASVRCVCDMTPLGFVTWYYNQYGSYNHQLS